jgi:hypothetical protein
LPAAWSAVPLAWSLGSAGSIRAPDHPLSTQVSQTSVGFCRSRADRPLMASSQIGATTDTGRKADGGWRIVRPPGRCKQAGRHKPGIAASRKTHRSWLMTGRLLRAAFRDSSVRMSFALWHGGASERSEGWTRRNRSILTSTS